MKTSEPQGTLRGKTDRGAARLSRELRRLTLELQATEQRERSRLAELLHQDFQQFLAAARLKLSILQRQLPDPAHQQTLTEAQALLDQAANSARSLAADLAPPALGESTTAALQWLATQMQRDHHLQVDLQITGDCEIVDLRLRELLFQCVRELLFNVHKHAAIGTAQVIVRRTSANQLEALVRDTGRGTAAITPGFGLRTMQMRLKHIGGCLELRSAPASGTTARILLPL